MKVYHIESNLKLTKCRSDNSIIFAHRTLDGIRDCPDYEDEKPTDYMERMIIESNDGECCKEQRSTNKNRPVETWLTFDRFKLVNLRKGIVIPTKQLYNWWWI